MIRRSAAILIGVLATAAPAAADDPSELSDEELDEALDEQLDEPLPEPDTSRPSALGPDGTYGRYLDVRLRYTYSTGSWGTDLQPGFFVEDHRDGKIGGEHGLRLDLVRSGGLRPRGGFFYGLGLEYARARGTLMTEDARRTVVAAHLTGGWAKPFGSRLQLELGLVDQLGWGSIRDVFPGAGAPSLGGALLALGAEANLVYTDYSGWQLAVSAGARYFELFAHDDMYKAKTTGTSTGVGAFLGKRY